MRAQRREEKRGYVRLGCTIKRRCTQRGGKRLRWRGERTRSFFRLLSFDFLLFFLSLLLLLLLSLLLSLLDELLELLLLLSLLPESSELLSSRFL